MRYLKITLVTLLIGTILILSFSCSKGTAATTTPTTRVSPVTRGNITLTVTGTGTLALSQTENLAFDIAGTVDEILVEASDSVTKGQELVKLDTSEWDAQVKTLQQKLESAQRDLQTKQSSLGRSQRQIDAKELAARQAELDVQSAQNNLSNISEVKDAQDDVDRAEQNMQMAESSRKAAIIMGNTADAQEWADQIANLYTPALNQANAALKAILDGTNTSLSTDVALQVQKVQLQAEQSQLALKEAQVAIDDAKTAAANAEQDAADAQQAVTDAQSDLDEAQGLSPTITAPFDGFITKINVQGGNTVQKGTVALQIADPNKFEANIMVTENDIFSVKVGGDATVSLDALPDYTFAAKITAVSPTATSSQGVVNYKVTAELTSLVPISSSGTSQAATGTNPGFVMPTGLPSGVPTNFPGRTRPTDLPSGFPTALPDGTMPTNLPGGLSGFNRGNNNTTSTSTAAQAVTLKDGLTATVTIITEQKTDVLMVPNRAITKMNGNSTVQVVNGNNTEARAVKTGLSDASYTEITEGLSEGDQVLVRTSSSSSSSNMFRMGGAVQGGSVEKVVIP